MINIFKKIWPIEILSLADFEQCCQQSTVLLAGKHGPRLLQNQTSIYKIFMPRKGFSSNQIWPYAIRFYRNAKRLAARGVIAPQVDHVAFFPENYYYWLRYQKLEGVDCREYLTNHSVEFLRTFAYFLAELHDKGIFFRGIHLGNVLYQVTTQQFCLIDFTDCHFSRHPLSRAKRLRNLKHLLNYPDDHAYFCAYGKQQFMQDYDERTSDFASL